MQDPLIAMSETIRQRNREALLKKNPELADAMRKKVEAEILDKVDAQYQAQMKTLQDRIAELEKDCGEKAQTIKALEAERDNWRKQALEENAAADAATDAANAPKKRNHSRTKGK